MGVHEPNLDATVRRVISVSLETKQGAKVYHATNTEADNHTTASTLRLHHGYDKFSTGLLKVAVPSDRVNLVRDIVMFEKPGQDAAGAEGVRFEGNEDENGRGERMSRRLEVSVEFRDQRALQIHVDEYLHAWQKALYVEGMEGR